MVTRPKLRMPKLDMPLALSALGLVAIGLLMVFSATYSPGAHEGLWVRQLIWALAGLAVACVVASIPLRAFDSLAYPLYVISLVFLALVLVMGSSAFGAKRWLDLGPIKFQPSELAKIATVLVLARRFDTQKLDLTRMRDWLPAVLIVLIPFALVVKEPDLGTSLSFPAILIAMLFWAGLPVRQLALALSPVVNVAVFFLTQNRWWALAASLAVVLATYRPRPAASWRPSRSQVGGMFRKAANTSFAIWPLILMAAVNISVSYGTQHLWNHLADYQKRRIETFLAPDQDPYGAGYQIIQSKIAVGSGGVFGKGYLNGTQKRLAFLPMRHTDFIYSVVGEELGFLGSLTVVILYGLLILSGIRIAVASRNGFSSLLAVGLVTALFYHIMVNMLMTIGWAPVTGLPLPLLSYGGTALIVNGIEIGLLQNVALRRHEL